MINFVRGWKFELGFFLIIGAALAVWAVTVFVSPEARQERDARKYLEELQAQYANDTFGGKTPEETLALFISALEKGDIELASKYFLPEDREEQKIFLEKVQTDFGFEGMVEDVEKLGLSKKTEKEAFYTITDAQNRVTVQVVLYKNPNGAWKIGEL